MYAETWLNLSNSFLFLLSLQRAFWNSGVCACLWEVLAANLPQVSTQWTGGVQGIFSRPQGTTEWREFEDSYTRTSLFGLELTWGSDKLSWPSNAPGESWGCVGRKLMIIDSKGWCVVVCEKGKNRNMVHIINTEEHWILWSMLLLNATYVIYGCQ